MREGSAGGRPHDQAESLDATAEGVLQRALRCHEKSAAFSRLRTKVAEATRTQAARYQPTRISSAKPRASLRSVLLARADSTRWACRVSRQSTGSPANSTARKSWPALGPVSMPTASRLPLARASTGRLPPAATARSPRTGHGRPPRECSDFPERHIKANIAGHGMLLCLKAGAADTARRGQTHADAPLLPTSPEWAETPLGLGKGPVAPRRARSQGTRPKSAAPMREGRPSRALAGYLDKEMLAFRRFRSQSSV